MIKERTQDQIQKADDDKTLDRRGMLTAMAVTAAGLVGAVALPSTAVANTGDAVLVGTATMPTGAAAGLYGSNINAGGGVGVYALSTTGDGVAALSEGVNKSGVWGKNEATGGAGITGDGKLAGVVGRTPSEFGYGVIAVGGVGKALRVDGKASFTRSGVTAFPKKKTYITVTVPGGLVTGVSKVIATMQGSAGSGTWIAYACKNSAASIKIRLNKKSTKATTVAWMVID